MSITLEDYVKTANAAYASPTIAEELSKNVPKKPYGAPGASSAPLERTLLSRAGQYIKAHPWRVGGVAAGGLGLGLLAHSALSGDNDPEPINTPAPIAKAPAPIAETPEEESVGFLPEFAMKGLERGVGGAITEGAKALGSAAYYGGRRLLQGRRQQQIFGDIVAQDPILSDADPAILNQSFATMSRFAPTLASDPYAAQSFLREAVTSGGGINYNTIKLLAEAERAAQQV